MRMIDSVAFGWNMRRCYRETTTASRIAQASGPLITEL
ncbi:hypothetical protein B1M_41038 [Burkholderia sp. TJI49]|nr:hypothetical protein B1M_41038 [Burkholderia sp. TJI49]